MSVKVSISSYSAGRSPENAVRNLVQAGFEYAELGTSHGSVLMDRTPEEWVKFREFAEGMGLKFRQGHLLLHRYITEKDEALRKENVEIHRQWCKMYHALGITSAVLHCGGYNEILRGEDPAAVRAIRVKSLTELLSDLPEGMSICLENLPYETFEDMYANLEAMNFPENLGLCLDTGHLHFCPKPDHEDFILRAGKYLKALHMHDNAGPMSPDGVLHISGWLGSDKHMFPSFFSGGINWYKVVSALHTIGYDHLWNLEVSSDLGEGTLHQTWRNMILRQDHERAEMLFHYDPEAPVPGDPVNDYDAIKPVSAGNVTVEVDKYFLKVTAPDYIVRFDPVHGGRISRWQAFDHELIAPAQTLGWSVVGNWQPSAAAFNLQSGVKIESVKAVADGVEVTWSKVLGEEDCAGLMGATYVITDTYKANGFSRKAKVINTTGKKSIPFAFRFHSVPALMGGKNRPLGTTRMDDGATFERCEKPYWFRMGEPDEVVEKVMNGYVMLETKGTKAYLGAPDVKGEIEVSFPGEKPACVFFWDTTNNAGSCEPIFRTRTLEAGESCEFEISVKHIAL